MRGAGTAAALKVGFGAVYSPLHAPQQLMHCASSITAVSDSIGTILSTLCDTRDSRSSMKAVYSAVHIIVFMAVSEGPRTLLRPGVSSAHLRHVQGGN